MNDHEDEGAQQCFANSCHAVFANPEWQLVHGWMTISAVGLRDFVVPHAWLEGDWQGQRWCYDSADPDNVHCVTSAVYYREKRIVNAQIYYTEAEARRLHQQFNDDLGPWAADYKARAYAANDSYYEFLDQVQTGPQ